MRIVSDSLGYVGIGTSSPTTVLHIKKNIPAPPSGTGANTVLKIQNGYGSGNFGLNKYGGYWQNSSVVGSFEGGFTFYNLGGAGYFGISGSGNVGIGITDATALLQIKAGTGSIAPFKLTSGNLLNSPQVGAIEFFNGIYYATVTGPVRKTFAFLESPTFTGTVGGITKNMIGLDNVDNTSDVNKPVSTATQTALDLKWGLTGNAGISASTNFIGTTDNVPFNIRVNNQNAGRVDNILSNTFWGYQAGNINSTGTANTAIGANTLLANTTGSSNTAVGSGANVSIDGLTNATALGSGAIADASNKLRLGNTSVTVIEGQVAYSFPSDARFKYDIQANVPGLAFIKKLIPVTYYFDEEKLTEYTRTGIINSGITKPVIYKGEKQLHTGFLAQDVEKIANELGYNFDGVHAPVNGKDHYSLAYTQFIMPLVKSVQEQEQIIEYQNKKIDNQAEQIKKMNEQLEMLTKAVKELTNLKKGNLTGK
ncbi:MAG: tail fiber domain-containing protein [Bacteroidota bacterium]|nr:tail fiber domain-containing protein [Bacteroidota bacterium]